MEDGDGEVVTLISRLELSSAKFSGVSGSWSFDHLAVGSGQNQPAEESPFGRVYVMHKRWGLESYHFDSGEEAYILYDWCRCTCFRPFDLAPLDDGRPHPRRVDFSLIHYDAEERKLRASTSWQADGGTTWLGEGLREYEIVFSADFSEISRGTIQCFRPGADVPSRTLEYEDKKYFQVTCDACRKQRRSLHYRPGPQWYHRLGSHKDLCHDHWQELGDVEKATYINIRGPDSLGDDKGRYRKNAPRLFYKRWRPIGVRFCTAVTFAVAVTLTCALVLFQWLAQMSLAATVAYSDQIAEFVRSHVVSVPHSMVAIIVVYIVLAHIVVFCIMYRFTHGAVSAIVGAVRLFQFVPPALCRWRRQAAVSLWRHDEPDVAGEDDAEMVFGHRLFAETLFAFLQPALMFSLALSCGFLSRGRLAPGWAAVVQLPLVLRAKLMELELIRSNASVPRMCREPPEQDVGIGLPHLLAQDLEALPRSPFMASTFEILDFGWDGIALATAFLNDGEVHTRVAEVWQGMPGVFLRAAQLLHLWGLMAAVLLASLAAQVTLALADDDVATVSLFRAELAGLGALADRLEVLGVARAGMFRVMGVGIARTFMETGPQVFLQTSLLMALHSSLLEQPSTLLSVLMSLVTLTRKILQVAERVWKLLAWLVQNSRWLETVLFLLVCGFPMLVIALLIPLIMMWLVMVELCPEHAWSMSTGCVEFRR